MLPLFGGGMKFRPDQWERSIQQEFGRPAVEVVRDFATVDPVLPLRDTASELRCPEPFLRKFRAQHGIRWRRVEREPSAKASEAVRRQNRERGRGIFADLAEITGVEPVTIFRRAERGKPRHKWVTKPIRSET